MRSATTANNVRSFQDSLRPPFRIGIGNTKLSGIKVLF